jgi:hypothetical protein
VLASMIVKSVQSLELQLQHVFKCVCESLISVRVSKK